MGGEDERKDIYGYKKGLEKIVRMVRPGSFYDMATPWEGSSVEEQGVGDRK